MHYNWHRHYDPSLGRYTQPDPLGFIDGPSVYAYAGGNSITYVDKDGRWVIIGGLIGGFGNFSYQLYKNGGNVGCVRWGDVFAWAGIGSGFGGVARGLGTAALRTELGMWGPRGKVWTNMGIRIPHFHFGTGTLTSHHLPWEIRNWGYHFLALWRRGKAGAEISALADIGLGGTAIGLGATAPSNSNQNCGCR